MALPARRNARGAAQRALAEQAARYKDAAVHRMARTLTRSFQAFSDLLPAPAPSPGAGAGLGPAGNDGGGAPPAGAVGAGALPACAQQADGCAGPMGAQQPPAQKQLLVLDLSLRHLMDCGLVDPSSGAPDGLSGLVLHLFWTAPSNFVMAKLVQQGVFHDLLAGRSSYSAGGGSGAGRAHGGLRTAAPSQAAAGPARSGSAAGGNMLDGEGGAAWADEPDRLRRFMLVLAHVFQRWAGSSAACQAAFVEGPGMRMGQGLHAHCQPPWRPLRPAAGRIHLS